MKTYTAEATIYTERFVTMDGVAADFTVLQAAADDFPFGISGRYGNAAPLPSESDPIPAAEAGESIEVIRPGDPQNNTAILELGGTVTRGERVMPDANGKGITATTGKYYGAIAEESGVDGDKIVVTPVSGLMA